MPCRPVQSNDFSRATFAGLLVFVLSAPDPSFAQGKPGSDGMHVTFNPFDPSETVSHTPKDDIRLRLRLPAPDLPPSVVTSKEPAVTATKASPEAPPTVKPAVGLRQETGTPGILERSVQSVVSLFDWSDSETSQPEIGETQKIIDSSEPIRINIHVELSKPSAAKDSMETADAESPWIRTQSRVRRLFTLGETDTRE